MKLMLIRRRVQRINIHSKMKKIKILKLLLHFSEEGKEFDKCSIFNCYSKLDFFLQIEIFTE